MRPRRPFSVEVLETRRLLAASLEFATASQTVSNAMPSVLVTVFRGDDTSGTVAVNYSTANGTAVAGVDYTAKAGILQFDPGETEESFLVTLANRPYAPAAQTFTVSLSPPSPGAYLGTNTVHTVTLQNDRSPVTLAASSFTKSTDDTGIDFVLTRAGNTDAVVSVDYATGDITALAGTDYTDTSGTLSFLTGETSKTVHVPLESNFDATNGVQFGFALFNPADGAVLIGTSAATVTITNSHAPIRLVPDSYTVNTDDEDLLVTLTRTGNTGISASVNYATADLLAVSGTDYIFTSGSFTFAPGETVKTFEVPLVGNVEATGTRDFTVALSSPSGAAVLGNPSAATIDIENPYSPLRFTAGAYAASTDDATVTLTVHRTGNLAVAATVDFSTGDVTADDGTDYSAASGTLTFAPGEDSKNVQVNLAGNFDAADGVQFQVVLGNGTGGAVIDSPAVATVTIANTHAPIQLDAATYVYSTIDSAVTLTVRRTGNTAGAVSVQYATSDGSALDAVDYTARSGTLNFAAGETEETITVPLLHNYAAADGVLFGVALSAPAGGGAELGAIDSADVSITNLQSMVEFDVANYVVDVRLDTVTLEVVRTGNITFAATVDFLTVDGTAVDGEDYFGTSGTLFFDAGQASQLIEVSVIGDAASPASRGFSVVLSTPDGNAVLGSVDAAAVDMRNYESLVQFTQAAYTASSDAGTATLTLTRVGNTSLPLTLDYATANGTAAAGLDYTAASGTVSFAGGQATRTISVPVHVNAAGPAAVTFGVSLSNPTGGVIGSVDSADVTVQNLYSVAEFDGTTLTVSNDAGVATLLVRRTGNTALGASVAYTTFSDTAVAGTDYTTIAGVLSFAAGEVARTIQIPLRVNALASHGRDFGVALSSGSASTVIGSADEALVTVTNVHSVVSVASPAYTANESAGVVTFTLSRLGHLGRVVSVGFVTSDATATAALDYAAGAGTVTFAVGESTATFTVAVNPDLEFDPDETFNVTLVNPADGAVLGASNVSAVTLTDTTPAPTFAGGGLVATQRPGRLDGVTIAFDQALQTPPAAAFSIFQRSADQPGRAARLKAIAVAAATYDPAARAVTVRPARALKVNVFYQLVVNADLIHNLGGKKLDGAGSGLEGSALVVNFGKGRKLRYVDQDGDTVQFSLRGPGAMELVRRADGEGERLTLSGTTAATKLLGTVRMSRLGGTGHTTLAAIVGLGAATNLLSAELFAVDAIA